MFLFIILAESTTFTIFTTSRETTGEETTIMESNYHLLNDKTTLRSESLDTTLPMVPKDSTTNNNNNLFQNDNTINTLSLQNLSTDTIDNKEIVYIYVTPSSAPIQDPTIISVLISIIICMAVTMAVGCIVCYIIIHKKSLSNQISKPNRDHQVEHGIDEYEDIDNIVETDTATELQQNSNKKEDIELVDNQAYSLVVIKNTKNNS